MSQEDRKFFDYFTLVIGILVSIAFGIFLVATSAAEEQGLAVRQDPMYQELVVTRLAPVGSATADGEPRRVAAVAPATTPTSTAGLTGAEVYNTACAACHGQGVAGAPRVGDSAAWQPRIAQGQTVLMQHALKGFTGAAGYMPPKGGRVDLSDDEILAALAHMLDESR